MIRKDLVLVGLTVMILALMVIPLNPALIDVLLAANISLSVLLILVAIYLPRPSDFSTFPSVILIGTAFRLALSIATTRMILIHAEGGQIIETFGEFVVGGSIAVGLVIFLIITVVQFLVVTKGAERVAEVSARFALDALPGKQMSIDADIRAGAITVDEGAELRRQLDRESQFFGSMDGAMKFVKGDAIAGIIIILINLVAGISVGVTLHNYSFGEAASVYSLLTVGDGLVAQVPALLMSLCAGMIVTRISSRDGNDLGTDIFGEILSDRRIPGIAAGIVLLIGLIPGFPLHVFAAAAALLVVAFVGLKRIHDQQLEQDKRVAEASEALEQMQDKPLSGEVMEAEPQQVSSRMRLVISNEAAAETLNVFEVRHTLTMLFDQFSKTRGLMMDPPGVELREMGRDSLVLEMDEVPILRQSIRPDSILMSGDLATVAALDILPLEETVPVEWVETEAYLVPKDSKATCLEAGMEPLDMSQAVALAAFRICERNVGSLFTREDFQKIIEAATAIVPETMENLSKAMDPTATYQVVRYLAEDGVPLRPLNLVFNSMLYWAQVNPEAGAILIAECMRGSMKRQLCHLIAGEEGVMGVLLIDPDLEAIARESVAAAKRNGNIPSVDSLYFEGDLAEHVINRFRDFHQRARAKNRELVVVTTTDIRRRFRNFLAANSIHLPVIAAHEISSDVATHPVGIVGPMQGISGNDDGYRHAAE